MQSMNSITSGQAIDNLLASLREGRDLNVTIKGGQGLLKRGTLMQVGVDGKYVVCDDETKLGGVLMADLDTTEYEANDVDFFIKLELDINKAATISSVDDISLGYYENVDINIK